MSLDGLGADDEPVGHFGIGKAFRDEAEDLGLAWGQERERRRSGTRERAQPGNLADEPAGDRGREQGFTLAVLAGYAVAALTLGGALFAFRDA